MKKEDKVTDYPSSLEIRVALVEMVIINLNQTLIRLEKKMDDGFNGIRMEISGVKGEINEVSKGLKEEFAELRREMKNDFRWILTIFAGFGAIMAHGFHWF